MIFITSKNLQLLLNVGKDEDMIDIPETRTSYWIKSVERDEYSQLMGELTVDVIIVGAGIMGLTTAYLLKKSGLKVAVLEKDYIGSGVSGYTTGKVTSQHNLIYDKLTNRLGKETARIYGEANEAAIAQIEIIITDESIECDWRREDSYVYTTDPTNVDAFVKEAATARSYGLPATYETTSDLPFHIQGAVRFSNQATFHIYKYLSGLARVINGNGSFIFEHSDVISINSGEPPRVSTLTGKVFARDVVVATNIPTAPLAARGTYASLEYPQQSYIVACKLKDELHGMYISPDKNHYSIMPVYSGEDSLLLIGGEGHILGTRWNAETRYERLAEYARTYFNVSDPIYKWSHRDYLGYDDMPLIGKLYPWSTHMFTATGLMKWGLTNGTVAAMILSDTIRGIENPWAATFDSNRLSPVLSIPKVIREHIG